VRIVPAKSSQRDDSALIINAMFSCVLLVDGDASYGTYLDPNATIESIATPVAPADTRQ